MIDKEEFEKGSFEENQKFIKEILRLVTHNAFTKDDLLFLIKWQNAIIEQMKNCLNCKFGDLGEDDIWCYNKERYGFYDAKKGCEHWEMEE